MNYEMGGTNSTFIRINQSSEDIIYSAVLTERIFLDNVVIQKPLGSSDHNQLHVNIKIKSDKTKVKQCRRDFRKCNYKEIRKSLAHIDWNDKIKNKTATECWNILRREIDSAIESCVPLKKQGKRSKERLDINKICGGFINILERIKIMWFTKRH